MEKDNKKARDDARREYNDTVRVSCSLGCMKSHEIDGTSKALSLFLRKRDPRYKTFQSQQATETANNKGGVSADAARARAAATEVYVEQSWQRGAVDLANAHVDLEWAAAEGTDDEVWECVVCDKTFRSEAAWEAHERSKRHIREVERLQQEMIAEEEMLAIDAEDTYAYVADVTAGGSDETSEVDGGDRATPPSASDEDVDHNLQIGAIDGSHTEEPEEQTLGEKEKHEPQPERKGRKAKNVLLTHSQPEPLSKSERRAAELAEVARETADGGDNLEPVSPPIQAPSKREKRRAREAAKKAQEALPQSFVGT
jgi:DnaJ homolog subfamily A member 5